MFIIEPPEFVLFRRQRAAQQKQEQLRKVQAAQVHPTEEIVLEFVSSYFDDHAPYWTVINECARQIGYNNRPEREQRRLEVRRHLHALVRRGKLVRVARKWIRMPEDRDLEAQRRREYNARIDAMVRSWPEPNV